MDKKPIMTFFFSQFQRYAYIAKKWKTDMAKNWLEKLMSTLFCSQRLFTNAAPCA